MSTISNCDPDHKLLLRERLSNNLFDEVRSAPPGGQLSAKLRAELEELDISERRVITSITDPGDNCAPLFIASEYGNLEIVEYLVTKCGADVEQLGTYECFDDKALPRWERHVVTPLWCASVKGKLDIVKFLVINGGADVNARSKTSGATPLMAACYETNFHVIEFLVRVGGADLSIPNFRGITCLMNSLQSSILCQFLLDHGADINAQDNHGRTALHYAIRRNEFAITNLLVNMGADPTVKDSNGDDAIRTMCLEADISIFQYPLTKFSELLERENLAEFYELMGARLITNDRNTVPIALELWKKSIDIRYDPEKKLPDLPKKPLGFTPLYAKYIDGQGIETDHEISEFNTIEDLQQCSSSFTKLWITSCLIMERILPVRHEKICFALLHRFKQYIGRGQHLRGIRALLYCFSMEMKAKSCVHDDTAYVSEVLTKSLGDLHFNLVNLDRNLSEHPLKVRDMLSTLEVFVNGFSDGMDLVKIRPFHQDQQKCYDRCLLNCYFVLHLLLQMPNKTADELKELRRHTEKLVKLNPRLCKTNETLLHLCCNSKYVSYYPFVLYTPSAFGSLEVLMYLIECGANVNDYNDVRETPLHQALAMEITNTDLIKTLLEHGAHLDITDNQNRTALMILESKNLILGLNINPLEHISLKCLAASAIRKDVNIYVPQRLRPFVISHQAV